MSLTPNQVAENYCAIAHKKTSKPPLAELCLAILGGAFVALAAVGAHMVTVLLPNAGVAKLIGALLFPTGLGMILVAGGELFTGNCMLTLAVARRAEPVRALLRNWCIVYFGNLIGAVVIAWLAVAGRRSDAAFLQVAIDAAAYKAVIPWTEAFLRAILCNLLVCAAVWMSYTTQSAVGKIVTTYFPVAMFVLCGTEHCVANMFYFSAGLFAGGHEALTAGNILLQNMLPVTLGNIVGGGLLYSGLLWVSLFRDQRTPAP